MKQKELLWKSDMGNGCYQNPILFCDYSDPDVIRVGDTFYMTASSFNYVPGLPILLSKDLIHWEIKNYAVNHLPFSTYDLPAHGKGIWAPSIRYHNDTFFIYVGMPDEGIFMTCAKDPLGKWSNLTCVWEGKGFIDPCPIWEKDGSAYIVHAYAKSRIGFKSKLGIFPINQQGTSCIGQDQFIYDGTKTQPTIEGPKIYQRNNYYYIFAPAGGVKMGWQTVLRARNLQGPYEEKIVLHQGSTSINGPHQGGLVDTPNKEEWFLHFQDKGVYGRICHLQPVRWKNDWPMLGINQNEEGIGEPVTQYQKPSGCQSVEPSYLVSSDEFEQEHLNLAWQWMANTRKEYYSLTQRKGYLRLFVINPIEGKQGLLWNQPNIATQKLMAPSFRMETSFEVKNLKDEEKAGIILIGGNYAYLAIKVIKNSFYIIYGNSYEKEGELLEKVSLKKEIFFPEKTRSISFCICFLEKGNVQFLFAINQKEYETVEEMFIPQKGQWVGAKVGIFAMSDSRKKAEEAGYVDIDYVRFCPWRE